MNIDRYVSSKEVIEQVYRDTGIERELPYYDLIYFIYEALELIGAKQQYIIKWQGVNNNAALEIDNYRAKLPCDFHKLLWILVNGCVAKLQDGGSISLLDGSCCDSFVSSNSALPETFTDNFGNIFSNLEGGFGANTDCNVTFDISNDYITLSVKEGSVCIGYYAFALDDEGFPLVPDDAIYKLAISKYLTKKIDYIEWRKGNLPKDVYEESEKDCNWYMGKVSNHTKMLDIHELETLKDSIVRLKPNINDYKSMFKFKGR